MSSTRKLSDMAFTVTDAMSDHRSRHHDELNQQSSQMLNLRSSSDPAFQYWAPQQRSQDSGNDGMYRHATSKRHDRYPDHGRRHETYDRSESTTERSHRSSSSASQRPPQALRGNSPESKYADENAAYKPPSRPLPALHVDPRFSRLSPREWGKFFKVGRVFATKIFSEDESSSLGPASDDYSIDRLKGCHGDSFLTRIRRMVVVKVRDEFCLTVPIYTYGLQGLKKPGLRESKIDAHAIIHMESEEAKWLDAEPHSAKHDIVVRPHDSLAKLHASSRICFERTQSVNYNERIMKIGMVTKASMPYLLQYWSDATMPDPLPGQRGKAR